MACINRTTNKLNDTMYHVYPTTCPVNYKKDDNTYEPIDLTFENSTSNIGDILLNRKNIFSTGIRKDMDPNKFVGIRPDNCQDGSKQIEISIEDVKINGISGYNINDFIVNPEPRMFLKLYKNNGFKDFEIKFKIHLKGLNILNNKYTETKKLRNKLTTEFINARSDLGNNLINTYLSDQEVDTSESHLRFYYGKVIDDFIIKFDISNEEEFGDNNMSAYNFYNMSGIGSNMYLKNCVVFYAVGKNINSFNDSVLQNIANKYNFSLTSDDGDKGRYFYKDGKKVGSYILFENKVLGHINTEPIPDNIKSLYIKKTFDETTFEEITLAQFETDMQNQFNYEVDSITVDTNYYSGDLFQISLGSRCYTICLPMITDENYLPLNTFYDVLHTLKDNGDNTYTYTKYLSIEGLLKNLGNTNNYIDVNINTDLNEETPSYRIGTSEPPHDSSDLTTMRTATTAAGTQSFATLRQFVKKQLQRNVGTGGSNRNYVHGQIHMQFDSSSISDATSINWKHKSRVSNTVTGIGSTLGSVTGIQYMIAKATGTPENSVDQSTIQAEWNNFDGFDASGWSASDVTKYCDTTPQVTATSFAFRTDNLNSTAVSDFNSGSAFKMMLMEDLDYVDDFDSSWVLASSGSANSISVLEVVNSVLGGAHTTDEFHYLEVTVPSTSTPVTENATFFGANI